MKEKPEKHMSLAEFKSIILEANKLLELDR